MAFSPDGKHIVLGLEDKTIRLWDTEMGEPLRTPLEGHQGLVSSVGFSPDGPHIMSGSGSGSDDKAIQLFDVDAKVCSFSQ